MKKRRSGQRTRTKTTTPRFSCPQNQRGQKYDPCSTYHPKIGGVEPQAEGAANPSPDHNRWTRTWRSFWLPVNPPKKKSTLQKWHPCTFLQSRSAVVCLCSPLTPCLCWMSASTALSPGAATRPRLERGSGGEREQKASKGRQWVMRPQKWLWVKHRNPKWKSRLKPAVIG